MSILFPTGKQSILDFPKCAYLYFQALCKPAIFPMVGLFVIQKIAIRALFTTTNLLLEECMKHVQGLLALLLKNTFYIHINLFTLKKISKERVYTMPIMS